MRTLRRMTLVAAAVGSRAIAGAMVAALIAILMVGAAPAAAQTSTPPVLACGRVVAYTPPTATAPGSITLGTTTFTLKAGSASEPPSPIAVGAISCMEENAGGEILARTHLVGDTICGQLTAMTPTSISLQGNRMRNIPVRAGTSLAGAQIGTNACFNFAINGAGNAEIVGFVGPAPAQAAGPRQLPSTSTRDGNAPATVALLLGILTAVGLASRLLRSRQSA